MWCKAFFCLFFGLLVECYPPRVSRIQNPTDQNSISGVNFIYFLGPSPDPYHISAVKEISDNFLTELGLTPNENPVLNTLLVQARKVPQFNPKNDQVHSSLELSSFRKKRSADPTYKKPYKGGGGGGGGCCNQCGQCGGGGSGSYSQSQSYSSSSSGTYSSGYGKK